MSIAIKEQIFSFLKENVIGKVLHTVKVDYTLENNTMQGEYNDEMIFSDLIQTESGLKFNMTTVTREKIYRISEKGGKIELLKDYTGTSVFQYHLAYRKSTSQMTGFMQLISSSVKEGTMDAVVYGVYNVRLENGELKWKEVQLLYRDSPAENNSFRPVAFDPSVRFYKENGKLFFEYLPVLCDVDPVTLVKSPSKDKYPPFIAKE